MTEPTDPWSRPDGEPSADPTSGTPDPIDAGSATPPAPPATPPTAPPAPPPPSTSGTVDPVDAITTETSVTSGGIGKLVAAGVGVALLVGGGFFAASQLAGNSGGASSPQAAVEAMFEAVENEDIVGVLEAMAPSERDLLLDPAVQTASELSRLGVLPDDFELDGVDGIDIDFADLEFTIDEINDEITTVYVDGGTATITVDAENLPVGSLITDLTEEFTGEPLDLSDADTTETTDIRDEPMTLTTIKRNGGWYVSVAYSVAEAARLESGSPTPDPANRMAAVGAETPEAALENMLVAAAALDLDGMLGLLAPDTFDALYDYAPLFLDDAQAELDELLASGELDLTLSDVEATSRTSGDHTFVSIGAFSIDMSAAGESVAMEYAEGCVSIEVPSADIDETFCGAEDLQSMGLGQTDGADEFAEFYASMIGSLTEPAQGLMDSLASVDVGLIAMEIDGRWYIDPVRSGVVGMVEMMRAIERSDIEDAARGYAELFESFEDGSFFEGMEGDFGFSSDELGLPDETIAPDRPVPTGQVDPMTPIGGGYVAGDLTALLVDDYQIPADQAVCFTDIVVLSAGGDEELTLEIYDSIAYYLDTSEQAQTLIDDAAETCFG